MDGAPLAEVGGDGGVKASDDVGAAALTPNESVGNPLHLHSVFP
jgi:hypothetical protein